MSETNEKRGDVMRFGTTSDNINITTPRGNKNKGWTPEEARRQPCYLSFTNERGRPMTTQQWLAMDDEKALEKIQKWKLSDSEARRMLKMLREGKAPTTQEFGIT